jgi:hypothetical protein
MLFAAALSWIKAMARKPLHFASPLWLKLK